MNVKILYVVHCVDAEGPLDESLEATFERLEYIFGIKLDATVNNLERVQRGEFSTGDPQADKLITETFSNKVLNYNRTWSDISSMNKHIFSKNFRSENRDDFGRDWAITWLCLDHLDLGSNPRKKAEGYGIMHSYYSQLRESYSTFQDEIQWHYHPKSITKNPIAAATNYLNSMNEIIQILCRRVIEYNWYPSVYRPGFHAERSDLNLFLEQWIPFDYGNQAYEEKNKHFDLANGRFGNWSKAPMSWRGYHPSIKDYQEEGNLERTIFRCLNMGTRHRLLTESHVKQAFQEARENGSAILSFTDHDFRDIAPDIQSLQDMLKREKKSFPDIKIMYCGAEEAAQRLLGKFGYNIELDSKIIDRKLIVSLKKGEIFGPQPFLSIRNNSGQYFHDNFDSCENENEWSYFFDEQTIDLQEVESVGIGVAGKFGSTWTKVHKINN